MEMRKGRIETKQTQEKREPHPTHPQNSTSRESNRLIFHFNSGDNGVLTSRFLLSCCILPAAVCYVRIRVSRVCIGGAGDRLDQGLDREERKDGQELDFHCSSSVWLSVLGGAAVVVDCRGAHCHRGGGAED